MPETKIDPELMTAIQARLDRWKQSLLDLTKRNQLLYFKTGMRTRLQITDPIASDVYQRVVLDEKPLTFPVPVGTSIEDAELADEDESEGIAERAGDLAVQYLERGPKNVSDLQKKLYRLRSDARTVTQELGINTLHVAIGLLRWRESEISKEWIESPLILAPVTIEHEKNHPYKLAPGDGDVTLNPTLKFKLLNDYGLSLPSLDPFDGFGEAPDLPGYFEALRGCIDERGWTVVEEMWLSHFTFQKLALYEDLSKPGTAEAIAMHQALGAICEVSTLPESEVSFSELDEEFDLPDAFPIRPADSSQLAALSRARRGDNLVVQGPPGTGKSQTITNLIAQSMRDGKTVLFVSEKKAALDVVHQRLSSDGLGDLCLEMHSHKANKRSVVQSVFETLQAGRGRTPSVDEELFHRRKTLRKKLDAYVAALHEPRDQQGRNAYWVHGVLARLSAMPLVVADSPIPRPLESTRDAEVAIVEALGQLTSVGVWDRAVNHPWRGAWTDEPVLAFEGVLDSSLASWAARCAGSAALAVEVEQELGLKGLGPDNLSGLAEVGKGLSAIAAIPPRIRGEWFTSSDEEIARQLTLLKEAAERGELMHGALEHLKASSSQALVNRWSEFEAIHQRFENQYTSFFSTISGQYRKDKQVVRGALGRKISRNQAREVLERANAYSLQESWIRSVEIELRKADPLLDISNVDRLVGELRASEKAIRWSWETRELLRQNLTDEFIARVEANPSHVSQLAKRLLEEASRLAVPAAPNDPLSRLYRHKVDGNSLVSMSLEELRNRIAEWSAAKGELDAWLAFERYRRACRGAGLGPFLEEARDMGVKEAELVRALEKALMTKWVVEVWKQAPILNEFDTRSHEQVIAEFREHDRVLHDLAKKVVVSSVRSRLPVSPPQSEVKTLKKEYVKKKRHQPLRKLLPAIPTLLPTVKPCLLMSPLSVASYLPRESYEFDLVIFDEASQVRPADAIGAMLRGRQVVIMGDNKQLPPSDFFFHRLQDDDADEDDAGEVHDYESILDTASPHLGETRLLWHYRSRDERLIAFSNKSFYGGELVTFPSPHETDETGVRWDYVSEGLWGRGGSKTNPVEARRVVDLIFEHVRERPEKSLGVVAMNVNQRDCIELEVKRRRQIHPECDHFFMEDAREPFFVKNLESVQGDERDEMIISVAYGPAEPGGSPSLNFGPLGKEMGHRRMNVVITRSKFRTTIVSSMRPDQLDGVAGSRHEGPRRLQEYLSYAKRGGRFEGEADGHTGEPESPFEEAVRDALVARNYKVRCQVGASGFRIDLAVVHPDNPNRYLAAIECDGAMYHSGLTARDRDRLRQEVLEAQGWSVLRVWSTDWIRHPNETLDDLVNKLETLRRGGAVGIRVSVPVPDVTHVDEPDAPDFQPLNPDSEVWAKSGLKLDPYDVHRPQARGAIGSASPTTLAKHLEAIVTKEGPIHIDAAFLRLARAYGQQRVGSQTRRYLEQGLQEATNRNRIRSSGDFLLRPRARITPRGPSLDGTVRPIEAIAPEEIDAAVRVAAEFLGATSRRELVAEVARALGYARTSANIHQRIEARLNRLIKGGSAREAGGFVRLMKPSPTPVRPHASSDSSVVEKAPLAADHTSNLLEVRAALEAKLRELTQRQEELEAAPDRKDRDVAIVANLTDLIAQLGVAMRKIDSGTYGTCESCHAPIEHARLVELPHASLCLSCKSRQERAR